MSHAVVRFAESDLDEAWAANERSARQALRRRLDEDGLAQMRSTYERRLRQDLDRMQHARVLLATARR